MAKLPVSVRLIRDLHRILMKGVRGEHSTPGELRRSQNWIGSPGCTLEEAAYVPPPVYVMKQNLSDWEKFLHTKSDIPPLVQCALMHYQFEAIHPFLDGITEPRLQASGGAIKRGQLVSRIMMIEYNLVLVCNKKSHGNKIREV